MGLWWNWPKFWTYSYLMIFFRWWWCMCITMGMIPTSIYTYKYFGNWFWILLLPFITIILVNLISFINVRCMGSLVGLLTGHWSNNSYHKKIGLRDEPGCNYCGWSEDTSESEHFLCEWLVLLIDQTRLLRKHFHWASCGQRRRNW